MRKLFPFLMLFGMLVLTACDSDSNDDDHDHDHSDAEELVGTWGVAGLTDATGDRSANLVQSYESVLITLGADNSVTMAVNARDDAGDLTASGSYTVDDNAKTLTATLSIGGAPTPLSFSYSFVDDNTLRLTPTPTSTVLLGALFQTSYTDPVVFTFVRAS